MVWDIDLYEIEQMIQLNVHFAEGSSKGYRSIDLNIQLKMNILATFTVQYKTMKFLSIFLLAIVFSVGKSVAQETHPGPVKWLTFEEAVALSKKEKKLIFIDVYTTWCGPCKMMDKYSFGDGEVAKILNNNFYPVKLNAEQKENISFEGNTFKFVPNGASGYHQLAAALLNNKLQYPSFVFMTEDMKIMQVISGFHQAPEFHKIVQFIGEGHFKTMKWEQWQTVYKSPYPANPNGTSGH